MESKKIVFIACSSRNEIDPNYLELASNIAKLCIEENYELAFGGASSGMMGKTFNEFCSSKVNTHAYTVDKYKKDLENLPSTFGYIYPNTFERTECLYKKADIILFLPGGTGTLSELFSCLEENRTTPVPKQIILYNYDHYFDKVLDLIYYCVTNNFNDESIYEYFTVCSTQEELKTLIAEEPEEVKTLKLKQE